MKHQHVRSILINIFLTSIFFSVQYHSAIAQENVSSYNVNFAAGTEYLYKNEHYFLNETGEKTLDRTKWTKITIDAVEQLPEQHVVKVKWSKWDVENVSLADIDANPNLWILNYANVTYTMNASIPSSRYQCLFNEQNASMADLTPDVLLGKLFRVFYTNEWNYFYNTLNATVNGTNKNELVENTIVPSIKDQQSRILDASFHAQAGVRLNGTYPDEPSAYYNSTFDLKLYLVYGLETNILLSYNINFSIQEKMFGQPDKIQRKIIFWNIRRPTELTEDYPVIEIIEIPTYPLNSIGIISILTISVMIKLRINKLKLGKNSENRLRFF